MLVFAIIAVVLIAIFVGSTKKRDTSFRDSYEQKKNKRKFKR